MIYFWERVAHVAGVAGASSIATAAGIAAVYITPLGDAPVSNAFMLAVAVAISAVAVYAVAAQRIGRILRAESAIRALAGPPT